MCEKVASDFFPTFAASKLGPLCGSSSELTKFRYLKEFEPFSNLLTKSPRKRESLLLSTSEKGIINNYLDQNIDTETLKFDDHFVFEGFKKDSLSLVGQKFIQENFQVNENISNECIDEEYFTADTDEENFIAKNDKKRQDQEKLKSLNAKRYISTSRGFRLETSIMEKINEVTKMNFIKNKSKRYKEFSLFRIVGIIDGICTEEKCILEIKTRSNFHQDKETITKREKMQALVYMNLHESEKCLFVECGRNGELKKTVIVYDDLEFQSYIVKSLEEFCNFARNLTKEDIENLVKKYS